MIRKIKSAGSHYWQNWAKKRKSPGNPQTLDAKNIYILPSGFGWIYGLLVLSVLTGAINYQISTIFLMTFLLAVIGLASAWETHANIKELSIKFIAIEDAEQGIPAQLKLSIQPQEKIRFAVEFEIQKQTKIRVEQISAQGIELLIPIETTHRGCFSLPRITVTSQFPFGIFRVWAYLYFDELYYVYPKALDPGFLPLPISKEQNTNQIISGQEELYDLKQVGNPWEQPNRIAWKIAAKGQGWYIKTMNANRGEYWLFKFNDLTGDNLEIRLQNMSYWLQSAEAHSSIYGMELGSIPPIFGRGEEHLQQLLRLLAKY